MSTTKTVNVTTGKVLHYTIKKTGYKPVSGSKLITESTTINVNMVAESSPNGVYVFGDRIGGIATFFGYFDSVNPNTQATQKYACFVLDAQYRTNGCSWNINRWDILNPAIPLDTTLTTITAALACKDSATWNTQQMFDTYTPSSSYLSIFYYARNPGGQALIIDVDGVNYVPQVPNIYELQQIYTYRTQLDALDPTVNSYSNLRLSDFSFAYNSDYTTIQAFSSTLGRRYDFVAGYSGSKPGTITSDLSPSFSGGVAPIFEIPVN